MSPDELFDLWERGVGASPPSRARTLAAWAGRAEPRDVATWPLGAVQSHVLAAWHRLGGVPFEAVVDCPTCAAALELDLDPGALPVGSPRQPRAVRDDDGTPLTPRLLTEADLEAVRALDRDAARLELARRALGVAEPTARMQRAVAAALEEADPAASWSVAMVCPACAHAWEEPLDLATFVWRAVDEAATHLMQQVADLATAFGWSEASVLALPPRRRAAYLELAVR